MDTLGQGTSPPPTTGTPSSSTRGCRPPRAATVLPLHPRVALALSLAGDLLFGTPDATLAVGAILTVVGTYALARELTRDHGLSLVAAVR